MLLIVICAKSGASAQFWRVTAGHLKNDERYTFIMDAFTYVFFQKKYDFGLSVWFSKPIIIKKYIKIFFCAVIPVLPSYKLDQFEVYNIILSFITRIFVTFTSLSRRMVMLLQYSQTFFFLFLLFS